MTQQKPSNVAVYFKVETQQGDPVGGLTADQLPHLRGRAARLAVREQADHPQPRGRRGPLHAAPRRHERQRDRERQRPDAVVQAVGTFTDRVEKQQKVAIYAFDGSPDLHPIVPFTDQPGSAKAGVAAARDVQAEGPEHEPQRRRGQGARRARQRARQGQQPLKFGTLVVFTDGTDRANRVPESTMKQHIREKPFDVFAIGLGAEIKQPQLEEIGKSGTAMAADKNAIVKAFDDVGAQRRGAHARATTCSRTAPRRAPASTRSASRRSTRTPQSQNEDTGSLRSDFDATGFAPGCDPNTPPTFDVTKGDALAPVDDRRRQEGREEGQEGGEEGGEDPPAKPAPPARLPRPPPPADQPAARRHRRHPPLRLRRRTSTRNPRHPPRSGCDRRRPPRPP